MKVKLLKVFRNKTDKAGNPLIFKSGPKAGQPYTKVTLTVDNPQYAGKYINGFENHETVLWKEGDEAEIEVTERDWQGSKFYDFKIPKKLDQNLEIRLQNIEAEITAIKQRLTPNKPLP